MDFWALTGMENLDEDTRYAIYARHKEELNRQLQGSGPDGFDSSSMKHISVNTALCSAFSVDQWRSTPSPKPTRKQWSDLPGATDWYASSSGLPQLKASLSRKLSQWHGSMKRAMQASRIPRLSTALYRPLAVQTAEARKLRVKNWTLQDREHNRWLNNGPPLPPFPGDDSAAPSSSAAPPPKGPTLEKKFRSSIPLAIKRKPVPLRLPSSTTKQGFAEQSNDLPRTPKPKTPSPNPFEAEFESFLRDQESVPVESTRALKRMGRTFPQGAVDLRDVPTEASALSIRGEGSRYPVHKSVTNSISDSKSSAAAPSSSNSPQPFGKLADTRPHRLRPSETESLPNDPKAHNVPPPASGNCSAVAGSLTHPVSYIDSSTQTESLQPTQLIIRFLADLNGESYKGSASLAPGTSDALRQELQTLFRDGKIHLNLQGVKITKKSDAKETAMAQTKSSAAKKSRSRGNRQRNRSSATRSADGVLPVSVLPALAQRSTQASHAAAQSAHPPSQAPVRQAQSGPSSIYLTIPDLMPLPLELPAPQIDMSAVVGSSSAQLSRAVASPQNSGGQMGTPTGRRVREDRKGTSAQRQPTVPGRGPPSRARRPITKDELAYERQFRLES